MIYLSFLVAFIMWIMYAKLELKFGHDRFMLIMMWYDIWVGIYIDDVGRNVKDSDLIMWYCYIFPIPCIGFRVCYKLEPKNMDTEIHERDTSTEES